MGLHIVGEEAERLLDLLWRMDDGYILTEKERQYLENISSANFFTLEVGKLPNSIGTLSRLTELVASGNQLTNLPESIGTLSRLTKLVVFGNQLTSLPESIGKLSQLTKLDVSVNQLTSLPESIGKLPRLTKLDVSHNQLTGLPESIGALSHLTRLWAFGNQLTSLPESVGKLSRLTELDVSRNQLTGLPESIGELSHLTELNVSCNQLISLSESIGELSQLTELCMALSGLQEVPHWVRKLSKLKSLDLSFNPLKTLPDWLGDMTELHKLNLSYLQLTAIPRSLLKLDIPFSTDPEGWAKNRAKSIRIQGTELSIQPVSLFDQSRDKSPGFRESRKLIEEYFETPKIPVREAKVIFLGDGKVGKTYTIQRLLHNCCKGDYLTKETHGILIEDLYAEKDGETYNIRVWDFGGQDIMHEMHRCFLTDRTCYVVMVDTRADRQTRRARYWLRTVRNMAPNAPILLLVNEVSGGKNRDLDYSNLQQEFSNLVGVEYCSSMDASDEEFRRKVEQAIFRQALNMDSCKMELPKSWESVRQDLLSLRSGAGSERKRSYYIDRKTFHCLCDQYSVPADDGLRAWLLTWLNDLGVCFSYHLGEDGRERSNDYKILDPMWLTSAIYKIIWEKEQTDDGLITLSEIHRILEKPGSAAMKKDGIPCLEDVSYNKQECGYVLEIMRMFRISYPADARTEFIPALCKTDSKLAPMPGCWKQHVACRFRYAFLPETVLHRLMIFCFANLRPGRRWRKGFWLECEPQGLSAVIRAEGPDSEENELQIDVYAQSEEFEAWMWLQPLCQQLVTINQTLSLKAEEFVLAENDDEEKWFSLDSVWHWKNRGTSDLQGERSLFPIQPLMDLIYGKCLPNVETKLMENRDGFRMASPAAYPQVVMAKVAELTGLDLSRPFAEQLEIGRQLIEEVKRGNDLRELEIEVLQEHTGAVEDNTAAVLENTWTLQQSNELLYAIRDGRVQLPSEVMDALAKAFRQSNEPTLKDAGKKMKWHFWKDKGQLLRDLLGDTANLTTVAPVLVKLGADYGPTLLKILAQLVPA